MLSMTDLLEYALAGSVPDVFVDRLLENSSEWDSEFESALDHYAYEFRPDLAVWHVEADDAGRLLQLRVAPRVKELVRDL